VATDLRGYGDSSKPKGLEDHSNYSKRVMARDQVSVMEKLGIEQFHVVGHDRGARVAHRLILDYPEKALTCTMMDILPTNKSVANLPPSTGTGFFTSKSTLFQSKH
jgi:haloacetate dehalogenase